MHLYSMNPATFTQQLKAMSTRLTSLYQDQSLAAPAILAASMKELGVATERLEMAAELLYQQSRTLALADRTTEINQQQYQSLMEFIPDAYLLTDINGKIQAVNRIAARLLNSTANALIGQSLIDLMPPADRQVFHTKVQQLRHSNTQEWRMRLQRCSTEAAETISVMAFLELNNPCQHLEGRNLEIEPSLQPSLQWLLRYPKAEGGTDQEADGVYFGYPLELYQKGATIPLSPQKIWQVESGLVKLTTYAENGQEILIGLAGSAAPFGSNLTTLPLYEATAIADTQLRSIPLADLATSAELRQQLLPQISQRLKQTEALLAIYGQPRVSDRLERLLELLKQEIGEPVESGIRIKARLTHADLATACCTTRVTVTRLINQLQQKNKLTIDDQRHLILQD
jgi:PAS domain S-box-containing protein